MRKILIVGLALLVLGSLFGPAEAAKRRAKRITHKKTSNYLLSPQGGGIYFSNIVPGAPDFGGSAFDLASTDHFASVKIVDASGNPITGEIGQDKNGDLSVDDSVPFCGSIKNFPVSPSYGRVSVFVEYTAPGGLLGECPTPSAPTSGTINVTLSNLK